MTCGPGPTYMVRRWSRTKPSSSSAGNSSDIRSSSSHWSALSGAKQWTIGNSSLSWGEDDHCLPVSPRDPRTIIKPARPRVDCHRVISTETRLAPNRCFLTEVGVNKVSLVCWEWRLFEGLSPHLLIRPHPLVTFWNSPALASLDCRLWDGSIKTSFF
jgi:hypothetical protein